MNFVVILSDQHHAGVAGHAGDPWVRTPNLDRLASEGRTFDAAYCASPLCVPSRSALLSGLHTSKNGCLSNGASLRSDRATFVHSFSNAGYDTVLCGRMHFNGPDQRHGFRKRLVGDITPTILGGTGSNYGVLKGTAGQSIRSLQLSGPGNSNVIEYDKAVTDAACDYLTGDHESPFFLMVGLYGPHCPYVCPPDLYEYYFSRVDPPAVPDGFQDTVHPAVQHWYRARRVNEATPDDVRRCRAAYYGLVELLDGHVGRILDELASSPLREDTAVVYLSDHGDMIGENGLFWKSNLYEGSVRVPLTISLPEVAESGPCGVRLATPVSLLDIAPTLISLGGAEDLPEYDGIDLSSPSRKEGRDIVSICTEVRGGTTSAMIRTGDSKLIAYHGYSEPQLFDLAADPLEQHDLASSPAFRDVRQELEAGLFSTVNLDRLSDEFALLQHHTAIVSRFGGEYEAEMAQYKENWRPEVNPNYLEAVDREREPGEKH